MLSDYHRYRLYEMAPGLSIWLTLILSVALSFIKPLWMIYFIIVFDVYWVLRVAYFSWYLILSWNRFRRAIKTPWFELLKNEFPRWEEKKNIVLLPLYNEEWQVIKITLTAILNSTYPARKMHIALSGEGRKAEHWSKIQEQVWAEFSNRFADILFITHPDGLAGEIPGKGSNVHYAEKELKIYADERGWNYEDMIVSVFDVDTIVHPEYFAHLTYMYLRHPNPTRSSFQPITLYNNNLWESPSVLRIMAFGTTFWVLFNLARLDNLITFSSHSMSFKAIVDCGGHSKNIVTEDTRIFYQCWLRYNGDYEVTPLYVPVSMDTVREGGVIKSLKNPYYQQRRWAWGTEHIPYLLWQLRQRPEIPWRKKFTILFNEWEGKWSWAVVAILITIIGRLPLWGAGEEIRQSALFFNAPYVLETLMTLAMAGLFISALMSLLILPRRPDSQPKHMYLNMLLQWILLPFSLIFFSSLPCLDAVTHLMSGKYLGFNVSVKKRT